jgi:hypothetical protein
MWTSCSSQLEMRSFCMQHQLIQCASLAAIDIAHDGEQMWVDLHVMREQLWPRGAQAVEGLAETIGEQLHHLRPEGICVRERAG